MTGGMPVVSNVYCTPPPPVMAEDLRDDVGCVALHDVCVAPSSSARSRRCCCRSTATIVVAPGDLGGHHRGEAHGAGAEHRDAGAGLHVERARMQPAPVWMPQPSGPSSSSGSDGSTITVLRSVAMAWRGERRLAEPAGAHGLRRPRR